MEKGVTAGTVARGVFWGNLGCVVVAGLILLGLWLLGRFGSPLTLLPALGLWSYSAGKRGSTVRVFERDEGGTLFARVWNPKTEGYIVVNLGHRSRKRAEKYARDMSERRETGEEPIAKVYKLADVFALYEKHVTPRKGRAQQLADKRRGEMFLRFFGNIDPHTLSLGQWQAFIDARSTGAIDANGRPVKEGERRHVRPRGVEIDLVHLRARFNWATDWQEDGTYVMRENPVRGYPMPKEKNPRRPMATADRYEAIRAVSDEHTYEARWTGKRVSVRSYLSEMLDIVVESGRRISAVCALRFDDLRLNHGPYGSIRWRADSDKMGVESFAYMTPTVRAAVDRIMRERPGIGQAPLFPSPGDPTKPITRHLADKWLREGEAMAGLEPLEGGLWHPYRRKWATERKHLPDTDVAAEGGWKSTLTLKLYQQPDEASRLRVMMEPARIREVQ